MEAQKHTFQTPTVHEIPIEGVPGGSAIERLIKIREQKEDRRRLIREDSLARLGSLASDSGIVKPEDPRQAHHLAIEHITEEYKVPVTLN